MNTNEIPALYYYVGQKIREERKARDLSQAELADKIGVARTSLIHWEEGKNRVQLEDLYRIAMYFGETIETFLPCPNKRLLQTREQAFLEFLSQEDKDG